MSRRIITYCISLTSVVILSLFAVADLHADQDESLEEIKAEKLKNCSPYRSKRKKIPVYEKPDTSSAVIYRLDRGERVCYIGEQGEFAIIDWRHQDLINDRKPGKEESSEELAFVRLVHLWPAEKSLVAETRTPSDDYVERIKQYYYYMRAGGVPEDVLGPFRPIIDPFVGTPECKAGKLCEKIKEEQEKNSKKSKK